jgi:RHS repeat-associated protein
MTCAQNANTNGPRPQWALNTSTNQLSYSTGCTYDGAGNLTKDCSTAAGHTYQWDAEGRVASVDSGSTWTFTYNAVGERVQWAYSNGAGANQQLFDPSGTWLGQVGSYDLVPRGAAYLVVYFGSETDFTHINNLSSTTVWTNHAGTAVEDILFDPWGQVWQSWGSGGYSFAQLPYYDTTTDTSITMFRHYSPNLGRWLSPDRMGGDITNPQSLNRYPYVLNNPTTLTDRLGLWPAGWPVTCEASPARLHPVHAMGTFGGGGCGHGPIGGGEGDAGDGGPGGLSFSIDGGQPLNFAYWGTIGGMANSFGGVSESTAVCMAADCVFQNNAYNNENPYNPEFYQWYYNPNVIDFECSSLDPGSCYPSAWSLRYIAGPNDALDPAVQAMLAQVYANTSGLTSPLFPIAWYGISAIPGTVVAVPPVVWSAVGGHAGIYVCAAKAAWGAGAAAAGLGVPAGTGLCGYAGYALAWFLEP